MSNPESPGGRRKKKVEVYCCECGFFEEGELESCQSPNNCFSTWKSPCGWRKMPSDLNEYNDCGWYKESKERVEIVAFQKLENLGD